MTKYLPAGCKAAKVNLAGAYRTTLTRLEVGDVVRLDRRQNEVNGALIPTPTHSPARSFWATVTEITRSGGQIHITTSHGQMPGDFAHTSITRKERAAETQERLALDAQAREDALRQAEEARIQTALAETMTPAEKVAAVAAVPLATPEALAEDLVRIGRELAIMDPISHAMRVVSGLAGRPDTEDGAYYGRVYACLKAMLQRALGVASASAMRQAEPVDHTHDFTPGQSGMVCVQMVERPDGTGDACGEPVNSAIHDPAAFQAFSRALDGELAKLRDPHRTATGKYQAGDGPLKSGDFVVPIVPAAQTGEGLRVGVQVWHPDFRGTVWVVWVIRHTGGTTSVDLVVPGTGDRLLGVNPDDVVRVTQENLDDYVASLAPVGKGAQTVAAFGALKRISERLTNGEAATTKLLNAEGTVRNLLASAKQAQARYAGRGEEPDQHAWERARARVRALEDVLDLLV